MKLYAYTLPTVAEKSGWLKIGQTNADVRKRIEEQLSTVNLTYDLVWEGNGLIGKREIFDHDIHRHLTEKGFQRDGNSEWFKCRKEDIETALDFLKQKYHNEDKRRELSDKFYEELRNWYYWATAEKYQGLNSQPREHDPDHALRIIVRLLLIFFLREKELIPREFFQEQWVKENLKNDELAYYNATLRNLFFFALNTPQNRRGELEHRPLIEHYNKVKELLHRKIPFLNGGLFNKHPGDDFALSHRYFFAEEHAESIPELAERDGQRKPVKGIITILNQYKYTLDETDSSEFIDPEFIGKIFESLLACIDADSKESRRKIIGSYYTPREIVDYMVNEALDSFLKQEHDANLLLRCSILDPACGSGAFPCGVMNTLMKRLDPNKTFSQAERYATKLEILRNVIYGIDIQPMAAQIAILRLFLSLLQEVTPNPRAENFGIEPLPNLDYKFAAANTLREIKCDDLFFTAHRSEFTQLLDLKKDYFKESNFSTKEKLKERIEKLEEELSQNSRNRYIVSLCQWNHSDTKAADYFDSRWMFGIEKFDIVIGNPPYIGEDNHKKYSLLIKNPALDCAFIKEKWICFISFFTLDSTC